jgi:hypothetical protein
LQDAFSQAGWDLPAHKQDYQKRQAFYSANDIRTNTPDGLHCVISDNKIGQEVFSILANDGVRCIDASDELYPPVDGAVLTMYIGRTLQQ